MSDSRLIAAPLRGVALLAVAALFFASMDTATKHLVAIYPLPLVMAARYAVLLLVVTAVLGAREGRALFRTERTGLVILRALCLIVASLFFVLALQRMPVAETTAVNFLAPLVVMIVARPVLGETIGFAGWLAALIGFIGVLFIVRPGGGLDLVGVGCVLATVAASVVYNLLSRLLARTETPAAMLFYVGLTGTISFGALLPWSGGGPVPSPVDLTLFVGTGIAGGTAHFLFTSAFRYAPASLLAPITYVQLIWAGLLGWLVFGHVPASLTVTGMFIVAASGVMMALKSARVGSRPVVPEPVDG